MEFRWIYLLAFSLLLYNKSCEAGMIVQASIFDPRNMSMACANLISSLDMKRSIMAASSFSSLNMNSPVYAAAAGEAIWENGASCGKIYEVACINPCTDRVAFKVMIVDRASTTIFRPPNFVDKGYGILLPKRVYGATADPSSPSINAEIAPLT